ncbi:hypothetical protein GY45DRAFT_42434 [Cubamyces sp. BRFM 1775]|nr:hypothetical protein GY45DRAFT_42434 [Cubamyces sp. BRFM 1775]
MRGRKVSQEGTDREGGELKRDGGQEGRTEAVVSGGDKEGDKENTHAGDGGGGGGEETPGGGRDGEKEEKAKGEDYIAEEERRREKGEGTRKGRQGQTLADRMGISDRMGVPSTSPVLADSRSDFGFRGGFLPRRPTLALPSHHLVFPHSVTHVTQTLMNYFRGVLLQILISHSSLPLSLLSLITFPFLSSPYSESPLLTSHPLAINNRPLLASLPSFPLLLFQAFFPFQPIPLPYPSPIKLAFSLSPASPPRSSDRSSLVHLGHLPFPLSSTPASSSRPVSQATASCPTK